MLLKIVETSGKIISWSTKKEEIRGHYTAKMHKATWHHPFWVLYAELQTLCIKKWIASYNFVQGGWVVTATMHGCSLVLPTNPLRGYGNLAVACSNEYPLLLISHVCILKLRGRKAQQLLPGQLFFPRKKEELPWVGFEPTTLCILGERSTY